MHINSAFYRPLQVNKDQLMVFHISSFMHARHQCSFTIRLLYVKYSDVNISLLENFGDFGVHNGNYKMICAILKKGAGIDPLSQKGITIPVPPFRVIVGVQLVRW